MAQSFLRRIIYGFDKLLAWINGLIANHNDSTAAHVNGFDHNVYIFVSNDDNTNEPTLILKTLNYDDSKAGQYNLGAVTFKDKDNLNIFTMGLDQVVVTNTNGTITKKSYVWDFLCRSNILSNGNYPWVYLLTLQVDYENGAETRHITASNLYTPTKEYDLTTKKYVDTKVGSISSSTPSIKLPYGDSAVVTYSDGSLKALSNVSSTEVGYLDGVTSNIQTQLNGKSPTTHTHSDMVTVVDSGKSTVTQNSKTYYTYYRKYSDGYLKQWGTRQSKTQSINLPISFKNTEYSVQFTHIDSTGATHSAEYEVKTKNTSSIEMKAWTTAGDEIKDGSESFDWVACGYWQ